MFVKKCTRIFGILFVRRNLSTVKKFEDIPSPRGLPLVGTTFSLIATGGPKKLHKYMDGRHKEFGPIFKDNVGPVTAVFLADPDEMRTVFAKEGKYPQHIKPESWLLYNKKHNYSRGLFFMDGEEWHHFRKIMNKLLLKGDLSWIEECCDVATNLLKNRILLQQNEEFKNLEGELYKWSLEVIVSVLIGAKNYGKFYKEVDYLVQELSSTVHLIFRHTLKLQLFPAELALKYKLKRWQNFEDTVKRSLDLANDLINHVKDKGDGLVKRMTEENMDIKDIDRIIVDLILSAGDTTAYTMSWMLFLMAKHKNYQFELRDNIKSGIKTSLLRNIVRESLRLYPVAPFITRFLPEDTVICGYNVPANTIVVMSLYTSGRSEKYFKNPDLFMPGRWARDKINDLSLQQASLPFGIGSRSCIGKKIAETQLTMTLSKLVENFDINILNEHEIDDILVMVSKPSKPLKLVFKSIS